MGRGGTRRSVTVVALALVLAACSPDGGADTSGGPPATRVSDGAAEQTVATVTSDDGRATLTLPGGFDGSEITITRTDPPAGFTGASGYTTAYDLRPSGTQLPSPAVFTVTIPAAESGFTEGVPAAYVAVFDDSGEGTGLTATVSRNAGGDLIVEAELTHFSNAVVYLSDSLEFVLDPPEVAENVGSRIPFELFAAVYGQGFVPFSETTVAATAVEAVAGFPLGEVTEQSPGRWEATCLEASDGPVEGAFTVSLLVDTDLFITDESLDVPPGRVEVVLDADVECVQPEAVEAGGSPTYVYVVGDVRDDWLKVGATPPEVGEGPEDVNVVGLGCSEGGECTLETAGDPVTRCEEDDVESCRSRLFLETDDGMFFVECPFGADDAEVSGPGDLGEVRCGWSENGITYTFPDPPPAGSRMLGTVQFDPTTDGEAAGVYDSTGYVQIGSSPAGTPPPPREDGPVVGMFSDTDGACGFDDFTDNSYVARIVRERASYRIEFEQGSTGDVGVFSATEDGIVFESDAGESYEDIEIVGNTVDAQYSYTSDGCTQTWRARLIFQPGYLEYLAAPED